MIFGTSMILYVIRTEAYFASCLIQISDQEIGTFQYSRRTRKSRNYDGIKGFGERSNNDAYCRASGLRLVQGKYLNDVSVGKANGVTAVLVLHLVARCGQEGW